MHGYVTYPEEWKRHYTQQAYHLIDPTLRIAQRSIATDRLVADRTKREFFALFSVPPGNSGFRTVG
ncbi:autoinducer binding domain-containing protein [Gemmobacter sp. 24YEA27]|uniref:autoinducer binding domain-containing protein n=1 Tax=Gemmobacter sp. 24YEA27 TaxID=3040672 RepID=UPI0032C404A5